MELSRRRLLQGMGVGAGACLLGGPLGNTVALAGANPMASNPPPPSALPIRVYSPRMLKDWQLPAERIPVGIPDDYKPTIALLPDGRLLMTAVFEVDLPNGHYYHDTHAWESTDGGKSWSKRRKLEGVNGHEPYLTCTSKGTLFLTTDMLELNRDNHLGADYMVLYRSTDGGQTWKGRDIILRGAERAGTPEKSANMCTRNVVEMPDGSLLLGVALNESPVAYIWRSHDDGETWEKSPLVKLGKYRGAIYDNLNAFFSEDFTFLNKSGKLVHFIRCSRPSPFYPMNDGRAVPQRDDSGDRMMMCTSSDDGLSWSDIRDCGDYGVMYPRLFRLHDGRLMMTYTQRSLYYPIGLHAIFSHDDGETWDFGSDLITIEGRTPWGMAQGGGFGNTVQLQDDTLVSCYSYRGADDYSHVEVVRWRLDGKA